MASNGYLSLNEAHSLRARLIKTLAEYPYLTDLVFQTNLVPDDIAVLESIIGIIQEQIKRSGEAWQTDLKS